MIKGKQIKDGSISINKLDIDNYTTDMQNGKSLVNVDAMNSGLTVPLASETVAGKAEIATQAEVDGGVDDSRIVTPKKLQVAIKNIPMASETTDGLIRLATSTEVDEGTNEQKAVTPLNLRKELENWATPLASETVAGKAEIATQAEVDGGVDDSRIVTPKKLNSYIASLPNTIRYSGVVYAGDLNNSNILTFSIVFPNEMDDDGYKVLGGIDLTATDKGITANISWYVHNKTANDVTIAITSGNTNLTLSKILFHYVIIQ